MIYFTIYVVSFVGTKFLGLERTVLALKRFGLFLKRVFRFRDNPDQIVTKLGKGFDKVPFSIKCLDQAIASWFWLNINGHEATLRIGVNLAPLESHAWVVSGNRIFVKAHNIPDLSVVAEYGPWGSEILVPMNKPVTADE